jgi:hypothetical protein
MKIIPWISFEFVLPCAVLVGFLLYGLNNALVLVYQHLYLKRRSALWPFLRFAFSSVIFITVSTALLFYLLGTPNITRPERTGALAGAITALILGAYIIFKERGLLNKGQKIDQLGVLISYALRSAVILMASILLIAFAFTWASASIINILFFILMSVAAAACYAAALYAIYIIMILSYETFFLKLTYSLTMYANLFYMFIMCSVLPILFIYNVFWAQKRADIDSIAACIGLLIAVVASVILGFKYKREIIRPFTSHKLVYLSYDIRAFLRQVKDLYHRKGNPLN